MSKDEAIREMMAGNKVTHRYFSDHEFIRMEGGIIYLTEGYPVHPVDFWKLRSDKTWLEDWELFKP